MTRARRGGAGRRLRRTGGHLRLLARVGVLLGLLAATASLGLPAEAASYRFWSYWTGGPDWTFSQVGPARVPADGSVEGWRFAVSPATTSSSPPRGRPTFAAVCAAVEATPGDKRVAVVVDFGTAQDAPPGESPPAGVERWCAVVPSSANGYAVLAEVASMRVERGLVCGIAGYPAAGCGEAVVDEPSPSASPTSPRAGSGGGAGSTGAGSAGTAEGRAGGQSAGPGDVGPTSSTAPGRTPTSSSARSTPGRPPGAGGPLADAPPSLSPSPVAQADPGTAGVAPGLVGTVIGAAVVAGLVVLAVLLSRRRGESS